LSLPAVFPDIEQVLVPWLASQLLAVYGVQARTCTETPENLADILPVVAVSRSAGSDVQAILDRPVVDVDCFAATRLAAGQLSAQVFVLMHHYLPGTVTAGAVSTVVGMVNTVKGPGWLTYQDLNVRRSNATYEVYQHPVPA
jgi:hypothetical protein